MDLNTLITLAVLAGAGIWLIEMSIRRSSVGIGLVIGSLTLRHLFGIHVSREVFGVVPAVNVLGIDLQIPDVVWLVLLVATIARWLRLPRLTGVHWAVLGLLTLVVIALAQGTVESDLASALSEARRYLFFLVAAAYGTTIEPRWDLLDRAMTWWLALAVALAAYSTLQMLALATGLLPEALGEGASGSFLRVIPSDPTLIVLQGAIIAAAAWRARSDRRLAILAASLLTVVLLLQHRSVWIAAIATLGVAILRDPRYVGRLAVIATFVFVAIGAIVSVAFEDFDEGTVGTELTTSATYDGSWGWRVEGWSSLLEQQLDEGVAAQLFGQPYGTGWERQVRGATVAVTPHNFYLEQYLRLGVFGLGMFIGLHVWVLRRLGDAARAQRGGRLVTPTTMLLLVISQAVYYVPYSTRDQGLLLGLALAACGAAGVAGRTREPAAHLPAGAA